MRGNSLLAKINLVVVAELLLDGCKNAGAQDLIQLPRNKKLENVVSEHSDQ